MSLEIREIVGAKDLKTFIYLSEKINAGRPNWVPPVYMDDKKYFNPKKNKAFMYCDVIMLLALRDGKPVGRIMGIINRRFNEYRGTKIVRFGYIEAYENREVVNALVGRIEDWGRSKGMTQIIGPYGFSDQDPGGLHDRGIREPGHHRHLFQHRMDARLSWPIWATSRTSITSSTSSRSPRRCPSCTRRLYERIMRRAVSASSSSRSARSSSPGSSPSSL